MLMKTHERHAKAAAIYLRAPAGAKAGNAPAISYQRLQLRRFCEARSCTVVQEFVNGGLSRHGRPCARLSTSS